MTTKKIDLTDLKGRIRDIPDFPKQGIIFKDITTLLKDKEAFKKSVDLLAAKFKDEKIDLVVGVEARGFIFGGALAYKLGAGFVPVRKKGKLPYKTKSISYQLEYGTDVLEIHEDAISPNDRVLIVDDLLATGGTIKAVAQLVKAQKAMIAGVAFLVELEFLKGKNKLKNLQVYSLLKY
ncbi:MAG TPA: adenine phosphoribosyltransferase [Candidatus Omnitrophica bacterium]|nr:MAG: adenine phosphoribosyltransferase [Omnitrophica WOR_2 bacterium GWA2_45_18]OGX19829.1 MAG: adenine phosphoribosyltransferase [Omnitrophica WOR_2 bacterium GWC2_45_7]HBR14797.1 adenine phosphoribosyltransferase [Candidatus Omnitrophota bacterium]